MRILSWNINGIRTLPQYHPWNTLKTGEAILSALEADIICFQEMKIQRTGLEKHMAVPGRFDSFFSFPVTKGGYSGVAVYTDTETAAPLKAEEGLTGTLQPKPPFTADERISSSYPLAHEMELFSDEKEETPSTLTPLDAEGRALVLDFGLFVLINVYCPAETSDTRLPYKMNFHLMLEERVRKLIYKDSREVIVVGDINVAAAPIDHGEGHLPSRQADFWGHPPRAWFRNWLVPSGPMVDVIRNAWPDRKGMYTCWNTKISARESNYGARIDYILLTRGLLPWFKHGDIQAAIRGSDHCPIHIDLHDEIQLECGRVLKLRDVMKYEEARWRAPRISAKFWKEFLGTQQLLSNFFAKKNAATDSVAPEASSASQEPPQSDLSQQSNALSSQPEDSKLPETPISEPLEPPASSLKHQKSFPQTQKLDNDLSTGQPKRKKQKTGQTKLSSFFAKSSHHPSDLQSPQASVCELNGPETTLHDEPSQLEADYNLARSLSESFDVGPLRTSSSQSKAVWTQLLAPLQPPKCKVHGEPCKEFTVNKAGPNKGKTFFICSRPVGPGYDKGKSERLREEVNREYKCDFFKWASEVKKESMKHARKGPANGSPSLVEVNTTAPEPQDSRRQ